MRFYSVLFREEESLGVAYGPPDLPLSVLPDAGPVVGWKCITFKLKDGGFADYQANDGHLALCSPRLRIVLDSARGKDDRIEWFPAVVVDEKGERRNYHVLYFPDGAPDVFDRRRTIFSGPRKDFVVRPWFSRSLIGRRHIFSFRRGSHISIVISERVKTAIEEAGITGMNIHEAPVSD